MNPLDLFHPEVRTWFERALGAPTRAQALGWPMIAAGKSTLLLAPTGSGKTLAAFLAALDRLIFEPRRDDRFAPVIAENTKNATGAPAKRTGPAKRSAATTGTVGAKTTRAVAAKGRAKKPRPPGVRVLYVSPLKALAVDVEKNLRAPLMGILGVLRANGVEARAPDVQIRTGDTPQSERARMQRAPPDILITTPESLYLLLTSGARDMLVDVETVIVDEIHSLVASKRGAHLFLSLERLEALRMAASLPEAGAKAAKKRAPLQRIGLSATQRPLDEVARLLGGFDRGKQRPVEIVDAGEKKKLDIRVEVPDIDMARLGEVDPEASGPAAGGSRSSIWPHLHERMVALVREHRSTMIFVNSRRLAERLASALNEIAGDEIALAHHGSVAREKRAIIEDRLKSGDLPCIVATSSLELGIDMGAVDLVIQVEAPPTIASGLQRIGRAGHSVGATSRGVIFPKHRADLIASAAAVKCMREGEVEATFYPRSPLDVLAQQLVAIIAGSTTPIAASDLYALAKRAAPFAELPRTAFDGVLDLLSGRYPSDEFAELKPRITWDRVAGTITAREGALRLAIANGGTIPDRGLYGVFLNAGLEGKAGSRRVGELDEEMVFELREGEVFLLGASSWRVDEIALDRVLVSPAAGEPGKMPFWHGDRPGRSRAFGEAIGELSRKVTQASPAKAEALLVTTGALGESAAKNAIAYLFDQREATGEVPSDKVVVVERFIDDLGDWRICVLSPFGARVHAPWATAVMDRLREAHGGEGDVVWSDDGMAFRVTGTDTPPPVDVFFPTSEEIERLVTASLSGTSLFAARFRENAARALLLPRRHPGKRTPLWAQRKRASDLLSVASRYPSFPILLETYRECLRDVFDLPGLVEILRSVEARRMRVLTVDRDKPSPFAASLLFSFVANFIYDGDSPLAERRAQALTIDHAQLRELLGETELRGLLDLEVIEEHERAAQRLTHPARHADAVHDMLLAIGDLSEHELRARVTEPDSLASWIEALVTARRVVSLRIADEHRFAAAEDTAKFRDALGVVPPRGLPSAFLEPSADPFADLVGRYARTHGPFTDIDVARRFGVGTASISAAFDRLVRAGRLAEGAFLAQPPGAGARELCDAEVLKSLRRKTLARLRKEVEPVDGDAMGRFLVEWQGIARKRRGQGALLAAIAQLEGCPLPASVLEREILPARVDGFRPSDLDLLCARGEVVWAGVEPLGTGDGRIALYLPDHEALLTSVPASPDGDLHARIRELLERRGAVFFPELERVIGGFGAELVDALWDMVWAGEVTNDSLEPLRSYLRGRAGRGDGERRRPRPGRDMLRSRTGSTARPGTEGRWSLRASRWYQPTTETERRAALARTLLERYGVVTREAAHAEGIVGGFSAVYEVLKTMEESGRIRRGYFIAGRGATQFALPGADERLRSLRTPASLGASGSLDEPPRAFLLAATDPANPYGAALPWPERAGEKSAAASAGPGAAPNPASNDGPRPQRAAGSRVILYDGALVAYLTKNAESLVTFLPDVEPARGDAARAIAETLSTLVDSGARKALMLEHVDGIAARESPLAHALTSAGFHLAGTGMMKRAQ